MQAQLLAPAATLVVWTLVMLTWTAGSRLPAMKKVGGSLANAKPGGRGQDLEGVVPDDVMWKSHNYTHLVEQPTLFYATIIILAIMGGGPTDVLLAWVYVALRIVHSLWQALVNVVAVRFTLFALSTVALAILAIHALMLTLFANPGVIA
jgi:hypothetical protein